jgi:orotate phosphoribosyltransferase
MNKTNYPPHIEDVVMRAGVWNFGDYTFASGKKANNKFEIPDLLKDSEAKEVVLREMSKLVVAHSPDAIWGVPSGGQEFARHLRKALDVPVIFLRKVGSLAGSKEFEYDTRYDAKAARKAERMVGIEDITTELTSVDGVLRLPEINEKTEAIIALWRRGTPEVEKPLGVKVEWVIEEEVPNVITPEHPFYQQYAPLARRSEAV